MPSTPPVYRITCYLRASTLTGIANPTIEQLQTHADQGTLEMASFQSWPDEVSLELPSHPVLERYEEFSEWAAMHDVSLSPAFEIRQRTSLVTDEHEAILQLPVVCLAVYDRTSLVNVFPHADGTAVRTVSEALGHLDDSTMDALRGPTQAVATSQGGLTQ